jgi:hypothetical protein
MGNYEIDHDIPFVRIKLSETEYEYVVSEDLFGNYAQKATRLFEHAYSRGQSDLRRDLRKLLNT